MTLKIGSTDRFGYEWKKYSKMTPEYELQFLKWVYPLNKNSFKGMEILDAGCGMGRNSFWCLKYGGKHVTAFDYNKNTINEAKNNLKDFKNCSVNYESIYDINYSSYFDISFSIGVIHHLEYPKKAIEKLIEATKKGGKVLIWVYGYEGNEMIVKYITPLRKVTSNLPTWIVHKFAYIFSVPLYLGLKIIRTDSLYLQQVSKFKFWHLHSIIFDQLIPKIANYWTKEEALDLLNNNQLKEVKIYRVNNNSWTVVGEIK